MQSEDKPDCFMYYKYVIWCVNAVICISDESFCTMKGIQTKLKPKGDNIEEPDM